jgi:serine/threonine-protein kinase
MEAALAAGSDFAGYRIERVIGAGGMGEVYEARPGEDGDRVALKVLLPELGGEERLRRRFEREARLAGTLSHRHVVPVLRSGVADGRPFLVMPYIDGPDLGAVIAHEGPLHPADAGLIAYQLGSALEAAHGAGLVHRDVKPANVFVDVERGRPRAYLGDFGLTKSATSTSGLTRTGMYVGTVDYAAPEQLQAEPLDGRADVYALGALLYQALTARVPFPRARPVDKIMAHLSEPPPRPSESEDGVPGAFDDVVARAMAKSADDRFQTAGELGKAALAATRDAGSAPPWRESRRADRRAAERRADPEAPTAA